MKKDWSQYSQIYSWGLLTLEENVPGWLWLILFLEVSKCNTGQWALKGDIAIFFSIIYIYNNKTYFDKSNEKQNKNVLVNNEMLHFAYILVTNF